jgi:hypothetical protein
MPAGPADPSNDQPTADPALWNGTTTTATIRMPVQLNARINEITSGSLRKGEFIACALSRFAQLHDEDPDRFFDELGRFAAERAKGSRRR